MLACREAICHEVSAADDTVGPLARTCMCVNKCHKWISSNSMQLKKRQKQKNGYFPMLDSTFGSTLTEEHTLSSFWQQPQSESEAGGVEFLHQ